MILPKMSGYVKTFIKDMNNKLMSLHIDDDKLLKSIKPFRLRSKNKKNVKLNDLPVYNNRYIKTKIRL